MLSPAVSRFPIFFFFFFFVEPFVQFPQKLKTEQLYFCLALVGLVPLLGRIHFAIPTGSRFLLFDFVRLGFGNLGNLEFSHT